jgi:hypothetical protein
MVFLSTLLCETCLATEFSKRRGSSMLLVLTFSNHDRVD